MRADFSAQFHPDLGIQRGERFIQQQYLRLNGQSPRQRNPLLLSAGKLVGIAVAEILHVDQVQHLIHALL